MEGYDPFSNLCGAVHHNSLLGTGVHFTGQPGSHTRNTTEIINLESSSGNTTPQLAEKCEGATHGVERSPRVPDPVALNMDHVGCLPGIFAHLVTDTLRCTG